MAKKLTWAGTTFCDGPEGRLISESFLVLMVNTKETGG